jgi:hypothetical protein
MTSYKNAPLTGEVKQGAHQTTPVYSNTLERPLQHFAPTLWGSTAFSLIALTGAQNGHNAPVLGGVGVLP